MGAGRPLIAALDLRIVKGVPGVAEEVTF